MEEWLGSVCSWNLFSTTLPSEYGLLLSIFHWGKHACNQDMTDLEGICPWHSFKIWTVFSPPMLTLSWSWSLFCLGRPELLSKCPCWEWRPRILWSELLEVLCGIHHLTEFRPCPSHHLASPPLPWVPEIHQSLESEDLELTDVDLSQSLPSS